MNSNLKYVLPVIGFHKNILKSGEGSYVYDVDGNKLLDLNGGQFCTIFGHSSEVLKTAVERSMSTIQHTNTEMLTDRVLEGFRLLNEITSDIDGRIITMNTGSEANEFAIRYAKNITGKNGLICFEQGYHGLTLGSQSVTYGGQFAKPVQNDIFSFPFPTRHFEEEDSISKFKSIIDNNAESIAACIIEPFIGVGGIYPLSENFLKKIKELCNEYGVLLIFDECQCGFGRTGEWFYYQKVGVNPDIVVTAKGIGLGLPTSAVIVSGEIVEKNPPIVHYASHQNDPINAEIIIEAIDYMNSNKILEHVKIISDYFMTEIGKIESETGKIAYLRGSGLMIGFDLVIPEGEDSRIYSANFRNEMLEKGVIIQATNAGKTIRILPNYLITEREVNVFISALSKQLGQ